MMVLPLYWCSNLVTLDPVENANFQSDRGSGRHRVLDAVASGAQTTAEIVTATGLHETKMHLDADEFLTPDRVPLEKAYQMVMSGEIKDGKTIAGILKLKALLAEGKL